MGQRIVGQARVKLDGALLETAGDTTLDIGGAKRDSVTGDYSTNKYRESSEPSKVEVNILYGDQVSLSVIHGLTNATLTIEYDTGRTWIVRGAYSAEPPSINQSDGKAKFTFMGAAAEEL